MFKFNKNIKGLSVLITGSASGIGKQLARLFYLQESCNLILVDKDKSGLDKLKKYLKTHKLKNTIDIYKCDISSEKSVLSLKNKIKNKKIDILINNAGIFYSGSFENMQISDFEKIINVDLLGSIRLTKLVLPKLLKSKKPFIINISSLAGLVGAPGMCAYSTAKFGLVGFSQSLASELDGRIPVCVVCPSFVKTDIAGNAVYSKTGKQTKENLDSFLEKIGTLPKKTAKEIIKGIKQNKKLVLINPDAYFFYYLHKFFPETCSLFVVNLYKRLLSKGVINL